MSTDISQRVQRAASCWHTAVETQQSDVIGAVAYWMGVTTDTAKRYLRQARKHDLVPHDWQTVDATKVRMSPDPGQMPKYEPDEAVRQITDAMDNIDKLTQSLTGMRNSLIQQDWPQDKAEYLVMMTYNHSLEKDMAKWQHGIFE